MQEHKANRNWISRTPLTVIDTGFLHFCLEYRLVEVCGQEIELTASKIRAVIRMRGEAGEHIASNPPYGYIKDPHNQKKWVVNEEAARVVRRIFDLCIADKGPMQIAKILTADKVLTVTAYNARQKGWAMPDNLYQWCAKSVVGIQERQEYTGCTVNLKTYTKSLKFKSG